MLTLSDKWAPLLTSQAETGMGYWIVTVLLKDKRKFDQVVIVGGRLTQVRGYKSIPFEEHEIAEIIVTHDKWDFNIESRRQ